MTNTTKPAQLDIAMSPVDSSIIDSWGYHAPTQTLRIRFRSGLTYDYPGVPKVLGDRMATSKSIGAFFGAEIRTAFKGIPLPMGKQVETSDITEPPRRAGATRSPQPSKP